MSTVDRPGTKPAGNGGASTPRQWERPAYLDSWGPPPVQNERYLFREPMITKHHDALVWAGMQIGFLTQAALDELEAMGVAPEDAAERLKKRLRDARREEAERFVEERGIPEDQRDARLIGHLIMQWEAALGVSGEIMINTPDRFLRRFYGGDPWDAHLSALILDIMGAEGEGFAQGVSGGRLTFRTNRYSCGGDPFDEWVVEPVDEESVGREVRTPPGRAKF
jgi:hypothetical protein